MSVGNQTQGLNFDQKHLTLVLGENLDQGGHDAGSRNGTGKTTMVNALSYAMYGEALTKIRRDNLVNKTNGKNMLVTLTFEQNGVDYRIERGRKPGVMKWFVNEQEQELEDISQGDSRKTQEELNKMIGMSPEMFKHIVALNTYTQPFLSLHHTEQQKIIEQLLGITLLSEKADVLKQKIKKSKEDIALENARIEGIKISNEIVQETIHSLHSKSSDWESQKKENGEPRILNNDISGIAVDHWNRYPEDIKLMKDLGTNSYRFSLSWSKIMPKPLVFDSLSLEHYSDLIDSLHDE